jgi:hypothetical protein
MRSCVRERLGGNHARAVGSAAPGVVVRHSGCRYATHELDEDVRYAHHHTDVVIESTDEFREQRTTADLLGVLAELLGLPYQTALRPNALSIPATH